MASPSLTPDAEHELVRLVVAGDAGATRTFVEMYQRLVAHIVFRMVDDPQDREELCQDALMRSHRGLVSFAFHAKLSTWIAQVTYRVCLNFLERTSWEFVSLDDEPTDASAMSAIPRSNLDAVADAELHQRLRSMIRELPVAQRAAVTLVHLDGFSVAEAGEILSMPEGTIKSHLFRARKHLKARLLTLYSIEEITS